MKKIIRTGVTISLAVMMAAVMMSGCGKTEENGAGNETGIAATDTEQNGEEVQMGNPWRDCTEQEAREACEGLFKLPEEDLVCGWSIMDSAADPGKNIGPMVQVDFRYAGYDYCARAQQGIAKTEDISGMYYEWDVEDDAVIANWGN